MQSSLVAAWQGITKVVQEHFWRFILTSVAWTFFFLGLAYLDRYLGFRTLFQKVSGEAWLGFTATIVTTATGIIGAKQKERQEQGLAAQAYNRKLIEQNNAENVASIREIEDGLDNLISRLNALTTLEHQQAALNDSLAKIRIEFAELDQRQKQGDRLLYVLDVLKDLIKEVSRISAILEANNLLSVSSTEGDRIKKVREIDSLLEQPLDKPKSDDLENS